MQLCDTGREIAWSINVVLPADLSDAVLAHLLDECVAKPIESYPKEAIALPKPQEPIEQQSVWKWLRDRWSWMKWFSWQ